MGIHTYMETCKVKETTKSYEILGLRCKPPWIVHPCPSYSPGHAHMIKKNTHDRDPTVSACGGEDAIIR